MNCIKIIKDEDFGLNSIEFDNPRIRIGARGIVIRDDGKIAIFNKTKKNEYKLPGGGVENGEDPLFAFKREVYEEIGCEVSGIEFLGTIEEHKSLDNFKQISYVFVSHVSKINSQLHLTEKERDEGASLLWLDPIEGYNLVKSCIDNLKESKYENLYHSKFIVYRDTLILKEYIDKYLNNKNN